LHESNFFVVLKAYLSQFYPQFQSSPEVSLQKICSLVQEVDLLCISYLLHEILYFLLLANQLEVFCVQYFLEPQTLSPEIKAEKYKLIKFAISSIIQLDFAYS